MPFTVSHAVLALPLRRTALPVSAVAVGAMAPDLRLFVPFAPLYATTHSLAWLPVTTLLAGALWLGWRVLVRPAASDLSPSWIAARYPGPADPADPSAPRRSPVTTTLLTTAALALGVLTHVVWDAFTHHGRWGTDAVPLLQERVGGTPLYAWAQDLSGVLGLAVIAIWFARRPPRALDPAPRAATARLRVLTCTAVVAALGAGAATGLAHGGPLWRIAYEGTRTAMVAVAVVILLGCALWHVRRRWTPR
ncbi:DUF4184 family protein [Litorihabitans aurantiacus]|uniref:DUF4184 family protein n=1 Tax=Litorihabitans aurantiacus TaxID=1930061 RepID=A0AA37XG03_9MICO|nr:DUF4184 family protein [Litorihabitans aurantiacus]GMA32389.1 hypothetical protein GCM10025875_23810 [Litorihabitans aurantiacus]